MRFRILLPLSSVILGVLLFHWGDIPVRRIVAANGGVMEEGITDVAAKAGYVHYALNAPAWAFLGDTRDRLWSRSTYWKGHDLYYFLAVVALWFSIGVIIDRRSIGRALGLDARRMGWNRFLAWTSVLYGLFTCYSIFPRKPYFTSLTDYLSAFAGTVWGRGYGWWWYPLGLAWGLGLITVGLYYIFQIKSYQVHDSVHPKEIGKTRI